MCMVKERENKKNKSFYVNFYQKKQFLNVVEFYFKKGYVN